MALAKFVDPVVADARAKLVLERDSLEVQLRSSMPLRTQLKTATAKLQRGLSTIGALHGEIGQLELVLEDRRRALEDAKAATLQSQTEVHNLTMAVRTEEANRIAACNAAPPMVSGGVKTAGGPVSLSDFAAGFYSHAPPAIAQAFQHFLITQHVAFPPTPSVLCAGQHETRGEVAAAMIFDSDEGEEDFDGADMVRRLAAAEETAAAATAELGYAGPSAFRRQRRPKARDFGPYAGGLEAGGEIAASAEAVLAATEASQMLGGSSPGGLAAVS